MKPTHLTILFLILLLVGVGAWYVDERADDREKAELIAKAHKAAHEGDSLRTKAVYHEGKGEILANQVMQLMAENDSLRRADPPVQDLIDNAHRELDGAGVPELARDIMRRPVQY